MVWPTNYAVYIYIQFDNTTAIVSTNKAQKMNYSISVHPWRRYLVFKIQKVSNFHTIIIIIIIIISHLYSAYYRKKNIGATVKIKNKNYYIT